MSHSQEQLFSHENTSDPVNIPRYQRHQPQQSSFTSFVATATMLPILSVTVLPLSVAYQTGKAIWNSLFKNNRKRIVKAQDQEQRQQQQHQEIDKMDSGYVVDPVQIVPREQRTYDLVVLGVTGFTGRLAARYLAQTYGTTAPADTAATKSSENPNTTRKNKRVAIRWAIAGRSRTKLEQLTQELVVEFGLDHPPPVIVVDALVPETLPNVVANTRVVATTAGPYSLYGNYVVEFCAKFGTHYVDITGEVDWVRCMIAKWQSTAEQTGARLVPFCGHDSVPWDTLVMKLQQLLKEERHDDLVSVTFWDEFVLTAGGGTLATLSAAVEGKLETSPSSSSSSSSNNKKRDAHIDPLLQVSVEEESESGYDATTTGDRRTRRKRKSEYRLKADLPTFIAPSQSPWDAPRTNSGGGGSSSSSRRWTLPFVMAGVNAKVVQWSHAVRQMGSRHLRYSEMQVVPNFRTAFCNYFGGAVATTILASNPWTHSLLKRYAFFKPGQGPSAERMEYKNYQYITGEGIGAKGHRAQVALYFTKDVGCLETARMMVEAGLCLALTPDVELPMQGGGFGPPSVALGDGLFDRVLNEDTHYMGKTFPATPPKDQTRFRSRL